MNKLKNALINNEVIIGTWMQIGHPAIAEILAPHFDWICIDLEHGIIDIETMANLFRAIENGDSVPIARIPLNDKIWIHRVLDAGAKGLIIPMVNTAEEAAQAVEEALYPPLGKRSFGYSRANNYGADFDNYVKSTNEEISIIIQIEHIDAINALDFILDVKGIDGTFIGPYDLSGSMGVSGDFESDEYQKAISLYVNATNNHCVTRGYHMVRPDKKHLKFLKDTGYKMIAIGTDAVFLEEQIKNIKNR